MERYDVAIEAMGYGHPAEEVEALVAALNEAGIAAYISGDGADVSAEVLADENRGLLLVRLLLDAAEGVDAQATAMEVWTTAWQAAFAEQAPPSVFALTALPVRLREATTA